MTPSWRGLSKAGRSNRSKSPRARGNRRRKTPAATRGPRNASRGAKCGKPAADPAPSRPPRQRSLRWREKPAPSRTARARANACAPCPRRPAFEPGNAPCQRTRPSLRRRVKYGAATTQPQEGAGRHAWDDRGMARGGLHSKVAGTVDG